MNPHFVTAPFFFAFICFHLVQGSGFMVHGSRFKVQRVQKVQRGWCGAFRHPERRKRSCVKKWLI